MFYVDFGLCCVNVEVKLRKEHLQEGTNANTKNPPSVEPITPETLRKLEAEEEAQRNPSTTTTPIVIEKTTGCQASSNKKQHP